MATPEKPVQLKVFVDKKKKKVMFAEAGEDFVEIILSFFTLPMGTIAKLLRKHADLKEIRVGCLTSLYESVLDLDVKHFTDEWHKDLLVNPWNSLASVCQKLKVNLDDTKSTTSSVAGSQGNAVLVENMANFIITDDLNVLPVMFDTSIILLTSLGVGDINLLEERTMEFGSKEFANLLRWSFLTSNSLTNLVFGGGKPCSSCVTNPSLSDSALISSNSGQTTDTLKLKLLVQKSNKKLLCAQVEKLFVEELFNFLTVPLGAFMNLTKDGSSDQLGISNLYKSISSLGDGNYFKSAGLMTMILCPKVAFTYSPVFYKSIYSRDKGQRSHFLKGQATFIVSNDLKVTASPSIATISKCNTLGVPVGEMEVLEVSISEHETLLLLKASLTSTSALTDFLNAFRKTPKVESST